MSIEEFQASTRFGLGAMPGESDDMRGDPRGWLLSQLDHPVTPAEVAGAGSGSLAVAALIQKLKDKKQGAAAGDAKKIRDAYIQETGNRLLAHIHSRQPFIERLTMFWSNHFTVSMQKKAVAGLVNAYEVQAIRPYVTGKFSDMLKASTAHPAMLLYLDQAQSIGPDSRAGFRRGKGLNENLAREIMELHTLGVNGGYSQADVISFARILTGWSLDRGSMTFKFQPFMHEPGPKTLLGRTYREDGVNEGIAALDDLARHPATAVFIATKLARHFIADDPPQGAVASLARVFRDTDGDLKEVSRALAGLRECWDKPLAKFRTPYEFMVAALRLTGIEPDAAQAVSGLDRLNYRVFNAASPAGYADVASGWVSSDAVMKRIEWSRALSTHADVNVNPVVLANMAFGPVASESTKFVVAGAETGKDGLAFLLSSPEFQRR
jgi:uncharacterized protein (DUF1800 family)